MSSVLADLLRGEDVVHIARSLIGVELISWAGGVETAVRITETEAYRAPEDRASHAFGNRRTGRTEVMFGPPGHAYVYLCYGIHEMFNVVTGPEGQAHAVLIRAGAPSRGLETILQRRNMERPGPKLSSGPGVLTRALGIDRRHNGVDLCRTAGPLRLDMTGPPIAAADIVATPRIGIHFAGEPWISQPWRFHLRDSPYVSGPRQALKKR
ncbi:DNA-3-methyladenine glycosylase [Neolewinella lacunae]|uniref:Putative 3-methyladenine DNA glycosylase n=1 Tax=Neolewinella lacunae TaxID=1517758 RepID=A0A923PIP3_9BACT|nr:DNA-3-methyladenine glycosylase [Neolewinella lacunae]MBC6994868.1 DNA-3-methyladenine glycosylase [Neolewinella lacunae]MDN3636788.1 DNA-3-methyladenine glycosylase [Neolewinella lacunae]